MPVPSRIPLQANESPSAVPCVHRSGAGVPGGATRCHWDCASRRDPRDCMITRRIEIAPNVAFGGNEPPLFIAGPCVIESREHTLHMAELLQELRDELKINLVFKASYDKANRSSISSFRGPGLTEGLDILNEVKEKTELPVLSDIHEVSHAEPASSVLDIIQIPAFLCRQTDLILAAAETGKAVAVKKGQFLSPEEARNILEKAQEAGNSRVFLTE